MKLTKENRGFWAEAFIDAFAESAKSVFEIGKMGYKSAQSARNKYNRYIQESRRESKIRVMTKGERVFLYKA